MQPTYAIEQHQLTLVLTGSLLHLDDPEEKQILWQKASDKAIQKIVIRVEDLGVWDSSLMVILFRLAQIARARGIDFDDSALPQEMNQLLSLAFSFPDRSEMFPRVQEDLLSRLGDKGIRFCQSVKRGASFLRDCVVSFGKLLARRAVFRSVDFWQLLDDCGPKALVIVTLISFLVGLILAFVGAIQLKTFGAQIFVASLVTIGMIRIMGAIMVGIIMAGRTGASYAATIGTMQVNEEIDALKTMGIPVTDFLVLPRITALVMVMPILVLLSDFAGILGGGFVGTVLLGISPEEYWKYAWQAFDLSNFLIGLFHGVVFGFVISICGCYFGIHCGRNADGVGIATTKAVVWAIVWMIVLTGIITFCCEVLGV